LIHRGEIWLVDLDPGRAGELGKLRPCIVVSDDSYNQRSAAPLIMPITTYPPTVQAPEIGAGRHTGLDDDSSVLALHIRPAAKSRFYQRIGRAPETVIEQAIDILNLVINGT